jgi:TRAP-type C4-dicarboxylate transport system permease small subunit
MPPPDARRRVPAPIRWIEALSRAGGIAAATLLAAITVMMLAEVAARSLANSSLLVTWELSAYCMGGAVLLGSAHTLATTGHVRVTVLVHALGGRALAVLEGLLTLFGLAVVGFLAYALGELAWKSLVGDVRSWAGFRVPLVIPQGLLVLGTLLLALQLVARLARLLLGLTADDGAPDSLDDPHEEADVAGPAAGARRDGPG